MVTLPVALVVVLALLPDMVPIQVERFATEKECMAAASDFDSSTALVLIMRCEVTT